MAPAPDQLRSEGPDTLSRLEKCVRQGDWNAVSRLAPLVSGEALSVTPDALTEKILRLHKALVAARAARVGLADSLARVRAAARFAHVQGSASRQDFAVPPKS